MKYKVIASFRDLENNLVTYLENEEYPKAGAPFPSKERIKKLITLKHIEKIEQEKKEGKEDGKRL